MTTTLYVVEGYQGSYDDYEEWQVIAYTTKEAAEEHAAKARTYLSRQTYDAYWDIIRANAKKPEAERDYSKLPTNPYDPDGGGKGSQKGVDHETQYRITTITMSTARAAHPLPTEKPNTDTENLT